ncbi:MAG: hypothetical protein K6C94_09010 [Candidatus Gastranaerophilales bacterium]|nr:hypothetical protein [Candidatus Gastranaerophilales bacterium]
MTIFKGDNLQAFNGQPFKIEFDADLPVSKAALVINNGIIIKEFENPSSPLLVELDENDTAKLSASNQAHFVVWDSNGRKRTCDGVLNFTAKEEIYHEC